MGREDILIKVAVDFSAREDGGLRATSPDVPGLVLSSIDANALLSDVAPAIEHILKVNHGLDVEMRPLTEFRDYLVNRGVIPPKPGDDHKIIEFAGRPKVA